VAVVGVGGTLTPMNDRVLPCFRNVDTLGVDIAGKGTLPLVVTVMVEGVRVDCVGEGGKTKSVREGVISPSDVLACC
jgi:hypothetical protein